MECTKIVVSRMVSESLSLGGPNATRQASLWSTSESHPLWMVLA